MATAEDAYSSDCSTTLTIGGSTKRRKTNVPCRATTREESSHIEGEFLLRCRIPGNDALKPPRCVLDPKICDLCSSFIQIALARSHLLSDINGRQTVRRINNSRQKLRNYPTFLHYSSHRLLFESGRAGCAFCLLIASQELSKQSQVALVWSRVPFENFTTLFPEEMFEFIFTIDALESLHFKQAKILSRAFEFVLAKDAQDCILTPYLGEFELPSPDLPIDEHVRIIKNWRRTCLEKHGKCNRRKYWTPPKRLIDVQRIPGSSFDRVKIVAWWQIYPVAGSDSRPKYTALSYCWGQWKGLVAKRDNISQITQEIAVKDMPLSVQDAIKINRACSIPYLWVDAYCICQDDDEEWESESQRMGGIYGDCEFVISALASSGPEECFLRKRAVDPVQLGTLEASYGNWTDNAKLFVRQQPRSIEDEITFSPLSQRAWSLQERILAPAVVHFGYDQMIWECDNDLLRSESGERYELSQKVIRLSMDNNCDNDGSQTLWASIVEEFTSRKLTYAKDRLLAIWGIESALRIEHGWTGLHVAGLWERCLDSQLAWYTADSTRMASFKRPTANDDLPTWSWARLNMPVKLVECFHTSSALASPPVFGYNASPPSYVTKYSYVCLDGFVQKVHWSFMSEDWIPLMRDDGSKIHLGLPGHRAANYRSRWCFDTEPTRAEEYFCIRIRHTFGEESIIDKEVNTIHYLVLRRLAYFDLGVMADSEGKTPTNLRQTFDRVGMLHLGGMDKEHFVPPYPDVYCKNGKPLLTDGLWRSIKIR